MNAILQTDLDDAERELEALRSENNQLLLHQQQPLNRVVSFG